MSVRKRDIPVLTFRTQITIEVTALDYVEAADHQQRSESLFAKVKAEYPAATFTFRQLRPRTRPRAAQPARGRTLAVYDDI